MEILNDTFRYSISAFNIEMSCTEGVYHSLSLIYFSNMREES